MLPPRRIPYSYNGPHGSNGIGFFIKTAPVLVAAISFGAPVLAQYLAREWQIPPGWVTGSVAGLTTLGVLSSMMRFHREYMWTWPVWRRLTDAPRDHSGKWRVSGTVKHHGDASRIGTMFEGEMHIHQSFEQIEIRITFEKSISNAIDAATFTKTGTGHTLSFAYENMPKEATTAFNGHTGFMRIDFYGKDEAHAAYFTDQTRNSSGTAILTRIN